MRALSIATLGERLSVLCLGAHSDDIEIGAGGTILGWIDDGVALDVTWCVLSAKAARAEEARLSADAFLAGVRSKRIELAGFTDSYFPSESAAIKRWLEEIRATCRPDVILTHRGDDAHQDHREVSRLTWNAFRDHLILEYEIPKWDGDLGRPNVYRPVSRSLMQRKVALLEQHFASQRSKDWFDAATFMGLARLRGMECRAPDGLAEAFHGRKLVLG